MNRRTTGARNVMVIETPEGVRFSTPLAGPVSRFLAWLVDELVVVGACGAVAQLLRVFAALSTDVIIAVSIILYFAIWVGYGITLEWVWGGQTIGKRALDLRVLDATGMKLQFSQIAVRNLMRFLDALPFLYLVGGAAMLLSGRYQRLGDSIAGTVVLRQKRLGLAALAFAEQGEKYNSFLQVPHLAARLRQQAGPELVHLAYQALLRRNELEPATRIEIFRCLADRFREPVKFPDDVTASLSDERYVRNAVGVVTATGSLRQNGPHRLRGQ